MACSCSLPRPCDHCGQLNADNSVYCCSCGVNLAAGPLRREQDRAERRQLTVMFCDLVDSTELSRRLDPEDLRDLIHLFQRCCTEVVSVFEGYIARYMGDGLLIYFGYPTAHERDAERSVHAALAIEERIQQLNDRSSLPVRVRIGIETGLVVAGDIIGEGEAREHAVLGDTPNLAARLQALAPENAVVVGPGTYHLIRSHFTVSDLGAHDLKGFDAAVPVYRVIRATEQGTQQNQLPLIGREDEVRRAGQQILRSEGGRIILIEGGPGLGKTRLLSELLEIAAGTRERVILRCSPFYSNRPFYPIIRHWKTVLRAWQPGSDADPRQQFSDYLQAHGIQCSQQHELLSRVLFGDSVASGAADPLTADQRGSILQTLIEIIVTFSRRNPLMIAVEDAHWIDSSTAALFTLLAERVSQLNLVLCTTSRTSLSWLPADQDDSEHIELTPLTPQASNRLIDTLSVRQMIPASVRQEILDKAGGLPLYVEELTKSVLAQTGGSPEQIEIPSSLHDSLRARLDRLGETKALAQFISVIGRNFSQRMALACLQPDQPQALNGLNQLVKAGLLNRSGMGERTVYAFNHIMIQEVAYNSLLHKVRRAHHRQIAAAIELHFPEMVDSSPELLAVHLEGSHQTEPALRLWYQAGLQACHTWAHEEAVNHYQRAVQLLEADPDCCSLRDELNLRLDLVRSLRVLDRSGDGLKQLERAEAIARDLKLIRELAIIHNFSGNLRFSIGDIKGCLQSHEAAMNSARACNSVTDEVKALSGLGDANLLRGHAITAEQAFDSCLALCRAYHLDSFVAPNLSLRGHLRLYMNRVVESEQDVREAILSAQLNEDKRTEMVARGSCLAKILCERADYGNARTELRQALAVAREIGAARFESLYLLFLVRASSQDPDRDLLMGMAEQAIEIAAQTEYRYIGAAAFGAKALVADDRRQKKEALDAGERLLNAQTASQNYLWFLRDAIEVSLLDGNGGQATHYARQLTRYTRQQPLPWADIYIRLATHAGAMIADRRRESSAVELQKLAQTAETVGLMAAKALIDQLMASTGD